MGLNLETLIGILVILILLILADGVRRMLRERHTRLRFRLDPRYTGGEEEEEAVDEHNPELPSGGARVRRRDEPLAEPESTGPASPPLVMEPDEPEPAPVGEASTQPDLFGAGDDRVSEEQESEPEAGGDGILEVIVVHVMANRGEQFEGRGLLRQLLEKGLRFGEMNIFHRHQRVNGKDELQFSMANAVEPGTFDIDEMEKQQFRAVTFFLKLPGPSRPLEALELMLDTAEKLAGEMEGELRDEQHSVLTRQTGEHLRQRVQEFERRQRVGHGH